MRKKITLLASLCCLVTISTLGQTESIFTRNSNAKRWALGLDVGPTIFHGDADDANMGFSLGLNAKYSISHTIGLKLQGGFGKLNGGRSDLSTWLDNDVSQTSTGYAYNFDNKNKYLALRGEYTFGNISYLKRDRKLHYVLFLGLGALWSDVKGSFDEGSVLPSYAQGEPDDFHNYKLRNFTLPFGLGLRYKVSPMIDLGLDYQLSPTRTDVLDGYSYPVHPNRTFDSYSSFLVNLGVKLGRKDDKRHVDWINPVTEIYAAISKIDSSNSDIKELLADDDNDGVANYFDKDPNTEEGAKTWGDGTAVDIDKDGVPDHLDKEPLSEAGAEVGSDGRMIDKDGDLIPDYRDTDANTPKGASVDQFGKHITVGGSGGSCCNCDDLIYPDLQYAPGSSRLDYASTILLYEIAQNMRKCPDAKVSIESFSHRNKSASNLNERRFNAAVDYLNAHYNIPRNRFNHKETEASGKELQEKRNTLIFR